MLLIRTAALLTLCVGVLSATVSGAFELAEVRQQGAILKGALDLGKRGDWDAADARVAGDPLLADIVTWRRLRAGAGTVAAYQSFTTRRGTWPGQAQLAEAVIGRRPAPVQPRLSGAAAERWQAFRRAYDRDRQSSEALLRAASVSADSLGIPAVWGDRRRRLVRTAMREGRTETAYALASRHFMSGTDGYGYADLEWLSGWVALSGLRDPARALPHFQRFWAAVETPISRGRGAYWLGRTYEGMGQPDQARTWFAEAARYPTSFYGQLGGARIGAAAGPDFVTAALPDWRTMPALRADDVRLAAVLHYADEKALAIQTFNHIARRLESRTLVAGLGALALEMGQPHYAVRIGKAAARRGWVIMPIYYPVTDLAAYASKVEPAFAMSIARQETELNPVAISRAGARGLMQLMPATARRVAGWIGEPYSRERLLTDWQYNARLGQTYLSRRVGELGGSYALAAAAYNAGIGRVDQWTAAYGDPRIGQVDLIDWLENIPFDETRNYVQRVMEGLYVYRARLAGRAGPMASLEQDLARGMR